MVTDFKELRVYRCSLNLATSIYKQTSSWPRVEQYSMTDQIRRSSRSVCANIGEAWFKRAYKRHFSSKLSDAASEASETIVWLDIAQRCGYIDHTVASQFESEYRQVIGGLIQMMNHAEQWCFPAQQA